MISEIMLPLIKYEEIHTFNGALRCCEGKIFLILKLRQFSVERKTLPNAVSPYRRRMEIFILFQ